MDKWDDIIDAYLNGHLDAKGIREFEAAFQEDEVLKSELEFRREVRSAMLQEEGQVLRKRIQNLSQDSSKAQVKVSRFNWKPWVIAASVFIILGSVYFSLPHSKPSASEMFENYYSPEPNFDISRSGKVSPKQNEIAVLESLYFEKAFPQLVKRIQQMPDSLKDLEVLYLEAISYIETDENDLALSSLSEILASENQTAANKAGFLKGLILIKISNLEEAKKALENVRAKDPSYKKEEIRELLKWIQE